MTVSFDLSNATNAGSGSDWIGMIDSNGGLSSGWWKYTDNSRSAAAAYTETGIVTLDISDALVGTYRVRTYSNNTFTQHIPNEEVVVEFAGPALPAVIIAPHDRNEVENVEFVLAPIIDTDTLSITNLTLTADNVAGVTQSALTVTNASSGYTHLGADITCHFSSGTREFTFSADVDGVTITNSVVITLTPNQSPVYSGPETISTAEGQDVAVQLAAANAEGSEALTWSLGSGSSPDWVSISSSGLLTNNRPLVLADVGVNIPLSIFIDDGGSGGVEYNANMISVSAAPSNKYYLATRADGKKFKYAHGGKLYRLCRPE